MSTASATLIRTDSWSAAFQSYVYFQDDPAMRARCDISQRLHVRLSAPSTALAVVGYCDRRRDRSSHELEFEPGRFLCRFPASDVGAVRRTLSGDEQPALTDHN